MEIPIEMPDISMMQLLADPGVAQQQAAEEHNQQKARIIYSGMAMSVLLLRMLFGEPGPMEHIVAAWGMVAVHGIYTVLVSLWLRLHPGPSTIRRLSNLFMDLTATAVAIYLLGPIGAFFYPIHLWIVVGNGMRFGPIYLFIAVGVAVAQFTAVILYSPFWAQYMPLALGLLSGLVVLPMLNWVLIDRLYSLNTRLEQRVVERTRALEEANAELSRANRAKDEFLATMSHELRTPLNGVLGLSQLLAEQRHGSLSAEQLQFVAAIEESGRHLLDLITDILDVARIEADHMELNWSTAEVQEICESAMRLVAPEARKKQIDTGLEIGDGLHGVRCDPIRLKQMLVNLLGNAVKFTPQGGRIGLQVTGDQAVGVIRFQVWDTGIGIAPEDLPRLFKPFVQLDSRLARQYEGTGLGLVLVYRMADLHGGSVAVESTPGQGSRFFIQLPWSGEESVPSAAPKAADRPGHNGTATPRQVLLAEDNPANITLLSAYLESEGHRVTVARDGLQAVDLAREQRPELILMDIQMPGMDGLEAIRRIRAEGSLNGTPIVALTALAMPGDRERSLQAGANEYLSKPVALPLLRETLERMTGAAH